jgi:hypothetical protein
VARSLDYSAVWADTTDMLRKHREAIVAIAGLLILVPNWASGFFAGQPDVEGVKTVADILPHRANICSPTGQSYCHLDYYHF